MTPPEFSHHAPGTSAATWLRHPARPAPLPLSQVLGSVRRVVAVAAHPDDESLGAGGLIAAAVAAGLDVELVILTDGEGSHPGSPTHSSGEIGALRRDEAAAASEELGLRGGPQLWHYPDGGLSGLEGELVARLVTTVGDGRDAVLVAPWQHDGHPDHETAGRVASAVAVRTGARLLHYPVWFWHWGDPSNAPWDLALTLELDDAARRRKARAIAAHRTQVRPLSDDPGDEVLLPADFLAHFGGPDELFVAENPKDTALDDLHARSDDPWDVEVSWYERRKRALTLAVLPRERFARALEVGCSRGALATALAARCDAVVAVDSSEHAIALAARAVPDAVTLRVMDLPLEWPEAWRAPTFDLVVISEIGYFLSPTAFEQLLRHVAESLRDGAVVVLCHWRHPIDGWLLDADAVGALTIAAPLPPLLATYRDDDVEILVLSRLSSRESPGA